MSGHNKWSTIKHKKGKADAARGKVFTKLIKEITVAAKMGGGDLTDNARLHAAVEKAKKASVTRDVIERAAIAEQAARIFEMLAVDDRQRAEMLALAQPHLYALSWENVVENYYLPHLSK